MKTLQRLSFPGCGAASMAFTTGSGPRTWNSMLGSLRGAKRTDVDRKRGRLNSWHDGCYRLVIPGGGADTMVETGGVIAATLGQRSSGGMSPQVGETPGARVARAAPIKFRKHPLLSHDAQSYSQLLLHLLALLACRLRWKQCQYGYHDLSRGSRIVVCCPERLVDLPSESAVSQYRLVVMRPYRAKVARINAHFVQLHHRFHLLLSAKQLCNFYLVA